MAEPSASVLPAATSTTRVDRVLWAIVAVAVAMRLAMVVAVRYPEILPWSTADEACYDSQAQTMAAGGGYISSGQAYSKAGQPQVYIAPGYPAFLAAIYLVFGNPNYDVPRILQALLAGFSILLIGLAAMQLHGSRIAGYLAAGLLAVEPLYYHFSTKIMTEGVFMPLVAVIYYLIVVYRPEWSPAKVFAVGLLVGVTGLCRAPGLVLVPPLLLLFWFRGERGWRVSAQHSVALVLGVALVVAPWTYRNYRCFGEIIPVSNNGEFHLFKGITWAHLNSLGAGQHALIRADNAEWKFGWDDYPTEVALTRFHGEVAEHLIKKHPGKYWAGVWRKWLHYFNPFMGQGHSPLRKALSAGTMIPLLVGALAWPFLCWRRASRATRVAVAMLVLAVLLHSVSHAMLIVEVRYRVPMVPPVLALLTAGTLAELWSRRQMGSGTFSRSAA